MLTTVQSILLNYKPNYNYNRKFQSNGVRNQLMFVQYRKTGENKGDEKDKEKITSRNLDHVTCNRCGEKGHYDGKGECSTQIKLKEDTEALKNTKQENIPTCPLVEYTKKYG